MGERLKLPSSIFKYIPEQYLEAFLKKGELLFRSLSYFQDYEDKSRGDEFEGIKLYKPDSALVVTKVETGEKILLPEASFQSSVNHDDIFVFCTSTILSNSLAIEFKSNICVEITNISKFLSGIRASLAIRSSIKDKMLFFGDVNYYKKQNPPLGDWALPEKIAMSKLDFFQEQREFRFTFAINNAFLVYNASQTIQFGNKMRSTIQRSYPEKLLKIGNITNICKVHRMNNF